MNSYLTIAVCTYNRAERLPNLVRALRKQECPIPFEILIVNNNSTDDTIEVLDKIATESGPRLRYVTETQQGITYARNRAISECQSSTYMLFLDDDELPLPGLLAAAVDAFDTDGADCAGGQVKVAFAAPPRPRWLVDELLPFLAQVEYGETPFWVTDRSTPLWTANIAYRMSLFRDHPELRFDHRYDRRGRGIGGGSDAILFREILTRQMKIRYRPDMQVEHYVESWRLKRTYFLKLHFHAGLKFGRYELDGNTGRTALGIPLFLFRQVLSQSLRTLIVWAQLQPGALRQAMNVSYTVGTILGRFQQWKNGGRSIA